MKWLWCPCGYGGTHLDVMLHWEEGTVSHFLPFIRGLLRSAVPHKVIQDYIWHMMRTRNFRTIHKEVYRRTLLPVIPPWVASSMQALGIYPIRQRDAGGKVLPEPLGAVTPSTPKLGEGEKLVAPYLGESDVNDIMGRDDKGGRARRKGFKLCAASYVLPGLPAGLHTWSLSGAKYDYECATLDEDWPFGVAGFQGTRFPRAIVTDEIAAYTRTRQRWFASRDDACPLFFAPDPCDTSWACDVPVFWFPFDWAEAIRRAAKCDGHVSVWDPGWSYVVRDHGKVKPWTLVITALEKHAAASVIEKVTRSAVPWKVSLSLFARSSPGKAADLMTALQLTADVIREISGIPAEGETTRFTVGDVVYSETPAGLYKAGGKEPVLLCGACVSIRNAVHYSDSVRLLGTVSAGGRFTEFEVDTSVFQSSFKTWVTSCCARAGLPVPAVTPKGEAPSIATMLLERFRPASVQGFDFPRKEGDTFLLGAQKIVEGEIVAGGEYHLHPDAPLLPVADPAFEHAAEAWYVIAAAASSLFGNKPLLLLAGSEHTLPLPDYKKPARTQWIHGGVARERDVGALRPRVGETAMALGCSPLLALCLHREAVVVDAAEWDGRVSWARLAEVLAYGQADGFRHGTTITAFLTLIREMGIQLPPPLTLCEAACRVHGPGFSIAHLEREAQTLRPFRVPTSALLEEASRTMTLENDVWH